MTFWVAGAAVVGGIGGALISSSASGDAADSQAQSSAAAIAEQRRQYDLTRGDSAAYREAGTKALGQLATENDRPVTAADAMSDPGYKFGLQQGQQGIDRKIAAGGGRVSGAAIKRAGQFATDYATTGYSAAYQRRQDRLNRLATLAGIGQVATAGSAVAGSRSADAISGLISSQGDATGASQIARGNIWGGAVNQIGAIGQKWATTGSTTNDLNTWRTSSFNNQNGEYG